MIKFKKIILLLIMFMAVGMVFNLNMVSVNAVENDSEYDELCEEISITKQ